MNTIKPLYECGDYIKVEFAGGDSVESEWMWVRVDYSDDEKRLVFGRLDSEPVVHTALKVGQQLAISYDRVRQHRKHLVL